MPGPAQICASARLAPLTKNYTLFMIPKPIYERLSTNMQSAHTNWQTYLRPLHLAALVTQPKEFKLKLSLETRNRGEIIVIHCQGRIVYRDEAAALSNVAGEVLHSGGKVVLDLSGVVSIDSAGIGELVSLHTRAQHQNADLKLAGPSPLVSELLVLTNVNSVLEIHPDLNEALAAFQFTEVCADC
jgi:anti-anti-sigma factor